MYNYLFSSSRHGEMSHHCLASFLFGFLLLLYFVDNLVQFDIFIICIALLLYLIYYIYKGKRKVEEKKTSCTSSLANHRKQQQTRTFLRACMLVVRSISVRVCK